MAQKTAYERQDQALLGGAAKVLLKSGFLAMIFHTSTERLRYRITLKTSFSRQASAKSRVT